MSLSTMHQIIDRVDELERRLKTVEMETLGTRYMTISEAASEAGYSYERFRRIRHRYGFRPGARRVERREFYEALAREQAGR